MRPALFVFVWVLAFGQSTESLTFEVASVKPSPPVLPNERVYFGPPRGGPGTPDPVRIVWTYARFRDLLMTAFDLKTYQLIGPAWLDSERYDVIVKVPPGATKEQVNIMWQNLLTERFGVKIHHEPKEFQVEELVIAKGGHKLKETTMDPALLMLPGPPQRDKNGELTSPGMVTTISIASNRGAARAMAKSQPLSKLTAMMSLQLNRPVLDKTGLTGLYDFNIAFSMDVSGLPLPPGAPPLPAAAPGASDPGPDLAAAVEKQLGLRLVGSKAKLDVVIIDKAEKVPTDN